MRCISSEIIRRLIQSLECIRIEVEHVMSDLRRRCISIFRAVIDVVNLDGRWNTIIINLVELRYVMPIASIMPGARQIHPVDRMTLRHAWRSATEIMQIVTNRFKVIV